MIEFFSKYKNLNKVLVILTSIAFLGGLFYTLGANFNNLFSNYSVKVGDIIFSENDYLRIYNQLRHKFPDISEDNLKKLVLNYLITRGLILDFAKKHKLFVSNKFVKEFIAHSILNIPQFDPSKFSEYAHKIGYSPEELFKNIKQELIIEKTKFYISNAPYVTNLEAQALYQLNFAKRNFKVLEITPFLFKVKISKDDIINYIKSHPTEYKNLLKEVVYYKVFPENENIEKIKAQIIKLKETNVKNLDFMDKNKFEKLYGILKDNEGILEKNGKIIFYKLDYKLPSDLESFPPKLLQNIRLEKSKDKMEKLALEIYKAIANNKTYNLPKGLNWQIILYNKDEFLKHYHLINPEEVAVLFMWPNNKIVPPIKTKEGIILVIPKRYYFINKAEINNTKLNVIKNNILSYKQKYIENYFINTLSTKIPIYINKKLTQ